MRLIRNVLLSIMICFFVSSCASIGPKEICIDRFRYNNVIQETENQQILANIVRLRYLEPTEFVKLINVTASYTKFNGTGNSNLSYTNANGINDGFPNNLITSAIQFNPVISYSDTPTISYSPVEDAIFMRSLMSPISLENLDILFNNGIDDPNTVLKLAVLSIDDFSNGYSATCSQVSQIPRFAKYYSFINVLIPMLQDGKCQIIKAKDESHIILALHFFRPFINSSCARTIKKLLSVPLRDENIFLSDSIENSAIQNIVYLRTRSVFAMMMLLSYGVKVPCSDIQAHYVYQHWYPNGTLFNWEIITNDLFTVYSSNCVPRDAFVRVFIENHWFYIKQNDLKSKATFSMLSRLITLATGKELSGGLGPALTLPAR